MKVSVVATACLFSGAVGLVDLPHHARGGKAWEELAAKRASSLKGDAQYWDAPQDHFNDSNTATYKQKYYVNDAYWSKGGPVFLEIGGEGPVGSAPGGFIEDLAANHSAMLIALEHRFYGESIPNGNVDTDNLQLLSVPQALADLAGFIDYFSAARSGSAPWVAFGGSYPGALSAWFRVAYPDKTIGSLSSSGVVNAIFDFTAFDEHVSAAVGDACADAYRQVTAAFERAMTTEDTAAAAKALFGASADMWEPDFFYMLADSMAMADQYGSKSSLCATLTPVAGDSDEVLMQTFANFTNAFWGSDFGSSCFYDTACLADPSQYVAGATDRSWRWQKCFELAYFQAAPSENSLRSAVVNMSYHKEQCSRVFGPENSDPAYEDINAKYGGATPEVKNVFFSDFSDDPWLEASVKEAPEGSDFHLVQCDDCGHCMDFHSPSDADPEELQEERAAFEDKLSGWLEEAKVASRIN